ncbi:MAG: tetratricopeptide repeat protein [Planctomycetota bacterium]
MSRAGWTLALGLAACGRPEPTFNRDIAPIVFENCAGCHRPGESGPFSLLSYADVAKRGSQIVEVTQSRTMPPWLPAEGPEIRGERRLSDEQIRTLELWVAQGMQEGLPEDLPPPPSFRAGWALGAPDLIVEMTEPYVLAASGPDVYRNFVIPDVVPETRYVRAFEFRPGNMRVAHHAFVLVDTTDGSLRTDRADPEPGFHGIHGSQSAVPPDGFFLSWTPGREPSEGLDGLAWRLDDAADLVIQLHLQPSGKAETIRSSVGLYFAKGPPRLNPLTLVVTSRDLDIPAGERAYVVERSHVVPIDLKVVTVLPHAHFLGKELSARATLPGGEKIDLLRIPRWDFNWQAAYDYREPVSLPRGTTVSIRFVYDNSADNPFNPHSPPQRVTYGIESRDEMCEFWLQVLPERSEESPILERDFQRVLSELSIQTARRDIAANPANFQAHLTLGQFLPGEGKIEEALQELRLASQIDPKSSEPHLYAGLILQARNQHAQAESAFRSGIALDPGNSVLHTALGEFLLSRGRPAEAQMAFEKALEWDRGNYPARLQLGLACAQQGNLARARQELLRCLESRPGDPDAKRVLAEVEARAARGK